MFAYIDIFDKTIRKHEIFLCNEVWQYHTDQDDCFKHFFQNTLNRNQWLWIVQSRTKNKTIELINSCIEVNYDFIERAKDNFYSKSISIEKFKNTELLLENKLYHNILHTGSQVSKELIIKYLTF